MGIFGRRRINAHDAAARFITENMQHSASMWPRVRDELRPMLPKSLARRPSLLNESQTAFYFAVARLACEMQAVRTLLLAEPADRVINAVKAILRATDETHEAEVILSAIDERWARINAEGVNAIYAVGISVFEALNLEDTITEDDRVLPDPAVLTGISAVPLRMGIGWWKVFLSKHRVV